MALNFINTNFIWFLARDLAKALNMLFCTCYPKFSTFSTFYKFIIFFINLLTLYNKYGHFVLIRLDQICPKWIKLDQMCIFHLSKNVTIKSCQIYLKNNHDQLFLVTFLDRWGNPIWSSLIHFGQIWSKKIKNKTAIFILSVNVTNFYSNIFRLVRKSNLIKFDQIWSILDRSDPKKSITKQPFLSFM